MPIKVSGKINLDKRLKRLIPDARAKAAIDIKRTIVDILVEKITSGVSPVKGQNRYKKYSDAYSEIKGRKSPVDLVKSGKMLENLKARITNKKAVEVFYSSAKYKKISDYHNKGTKHMPKRQLFPVGKQTFKKEIMDKITKYIRESIKYSKKKNRFKL